MAGTGYTGDGLMGSIAPWVTQRWLASRPLAGWLPLAAWLLACPSVAASEPAWVRKLLKTHCYRCHGEVGRGKGGFDAVTDLSTLLRRGEILRGSAAKSPLFQRMTDGSMPPEGEQPRPQEADLQRLRRWIDAGAPGVQSAARSEWIPGAAIDQVILDDLADMPSRARRFQRYFSLAHLHNAGVQADRLDQYRQALSKLVNSLSWHPQVRVPVPVNPSQTILRIDLRWYFWDAVLWNRVLEFYPYGILTDRATRQAIAVETRCRIPMVRADWFVATASRPPLYPEILQLPSNLGELERQLRMDARVNILQDRVMRSGFNGSGISKNNRILERHVSVHGYYWRTYDFTEVPENLRDRGTLLPDPRNVFAFPLGPGNVQAQGSFLHAGGEVIFRLPNGLQGYMLVNEVNDRIDKGPIEIVSDPNRPDRAVETGVSCMGCHVQGIIPKADQVRDHVARNLKSFPQDDRERINALYPPRQALLVQMRSDSEQYRQAAARTGAIVGTTEPVLTLTLHYEADLDARRAAAELGLRETEFIDRLRASPVLQRNLGAFLLSDGTVARPVWIQSLAEVVGELGLGRLFLGDPVRGSLPDNTGDLDPLEVGAGRANHMVFTRNGRYAIVAGGDRSVRWHDVIAGRDARTLVGHTASVWSVALSPNGRLALSGGMDRTVRLWDPHTGREQQILRGHQGLVSAVAFDAKGERAVSAGYDGMAIVWDLANGSVVTQYKGPTRYYHAALFHPDGASVLLAGDNTLHLWDLHTGELSQSLRSHQHAVTCLAWLPGAERFISGSDDGSVIVWDLSTGNALRRFGQDHRAIKALAVSQDGTRLITGGTDRAVRLWDCKSGKLLALDRSHADPVIGARFVSGGRQVVSGSRGGRVRVWNLPK